MTKRRREEGEQDTQRPPRDRAELSRRQALIAGATVGGAALLSREKSEPERQIDAAPRIHWIGHS